MIAHAWAIVDKGEIDTRTVSYRRLAAIVNWILVGKNFLVTDRVTDEEIERLWEKWKGTAQVVEVVITIKN